jgi:hypothetical protein
VAGLFVTLCWAFRILCIAMGCRVDASRVFLLVAFWGGCDGLYSLAAVDGLFRSVLSS